MFHRHRRRSDRRTFLKTALSAAGCAIPILGAEAQAAQSNKVVSLFNGKTLEGWIDIENSSSSFGSGDITDLSSLAKKISRKSDAVAAFLSAQLDDALQNQLATYSPSEPPTDIKAATSAVAKALTKVIQGGSLYESGAFRTVALAPETQDLLQENPRGADLVRVNRMLLQDAFPSEIAKSPSAGWVAKDGVIASTGAGRGVICTTRDFSSFRLTFTMRHVSGNPDHQACVLLFCTRPSDDELPLDALGGIQFQVPKGGHWDYRPGQNNAGNREFTNIVKPDFDPHEWSRVEILADAAAGTARMAVAQPVDSRAIEILDFKTPDAGKTGPIALQMHNAGLFDEYKDIQIEENPKDLRLITTG